MSTTRRSGSSRWSCSQPVPTRGSRVSTVLLLSEEVVFAGEGLGLLAGAVPVVLGEAALYDLALEKVFDGLDPTPRRTAEDAHEVVSVERALQPLDGGPHVLVAVEVDLPGNGAPAADLALALVCRLLRALRAAVGAAVLVDERAGLADVVEEGRLAQDGEAPLVQVRVGLDAGNHDQGVLEDVLVVELGLLLDLHRLHELRHDEGHEPETHEGAQARGDVPRAQDLLELVPYALGAHAPQPARVLPDRRLQVRREGEGPLGPRQGSLEADGPQHAQRVVAHPVERLPHRPDHAVLEILAAPEGVDDVAGEGVGRYGVYGEVAPGQVFFEALPETDLGVAAPLRVQVAAVRRDLDLEAVDLRPYRPESLPDVPEVPRVRPEQAFDLLGPRPRRGVRVQPGHPEQFVAHVPAYQVQLVPRVPERLAEAPDGLGYLQSFYVGHHSQTILVCMGARITDADVLGRPGHPSGGDGGLAGLEDLEEVAEAGNGEDAVDGIGGGGQA